MQSYQSATILKSSKNLSFSVLANNYIVPVLVILVIRLFVCLWFLVCVYLWLPWTCIVDQAGPEIIEIHLHLPL